MVKTYAVFGWSIPKLNEAVTRLEKEGHIVRGHELGRFAGYDFFESDYVMFIEHTPEYVETWKAKQKKGDFAAEIILPDPPAGYGEKAKVEEPPKAPEKQPEARVSRRRKAQEESDE